MRRIPRAVRITMVLWHCACGGPATSDVATPDACGPRAAVAAPPFTDATTELGIDFVHHEADGGCGMPDIMGGGTCAFDFDGDGDLDLFFGDRAPHRDRLYRNDGATFTDVSASAGVDGATDTMGCLAFDQDGDGDLDLFLSSNGADRLYRNDAGVFHDATDEVGLATDGLSTSATAGDMDGDGDLDLAVARFVDPASCEAECSPRPQTCTPYRNLLLENREGRLVEVGEARGLGVAEPTLASLFVDIDLDGDLDLYFGNDAGDEHPDRFYLNDGTGHFEDGAPAMGLAWDGTGKNSGSTMGVTLGDIDLDGTLDLASSNFEGRSTLLFDCAPGPVCTDAALAGGGLDDSRVGNGWAVAFVDFDQDGWLDLFTTDGRVFKPGAQPNQLWMSDRGALSLHAPAPGEALAIAQNSRGASLGDLDGDGDVDVVVMNLGGAPQILRNSGAKGHALTVALDTLSVGASVTVSSGGRTRTQPVVVGGGYLGSSDPRVHFGLGDACTADVKVRWLDGATREVTGVAADQVLRVERP